MLSFSSEITLKSYFKSLKIFSANSGNPSFFTNGKIAAFTGAKAGGSDKTVLSEPSSKTSSFKQLENNAKNILSRPIEVSTT